MDNRDVTLLNMTVRSIRDDPTRFEQYLDKLADDPSSALTAAIDSLRKRLERVRSPNGFPDLSFPSIARITEYATNQSEAEKAVVAALRSAATSSRGG